MKLLLARIKGVFYWLVGIDFIVSPVGETYRPVPVYIVMEDK